MKTNKKLLFWYIEYQIILIYTLKIYYQIYAAKEQISEHSY